MPNNVHPQAFLALSYTFWCIWDIDQQKPTTDIQNLMCIGYIYIKHCIHVFHSYMLIVFNSTYTKTNTQLPLGYRAANTSTSAI